MGEYADMAIDEALQVDFDFRYQDRIWNLVEDRRAVAKEAKKLVWTQKDGTMIHVTKMTDTHLENTIRFLMRKNDVIWEPWIELMRSEQLRRRLYDKR